MHTVSQMTQQLQQDIQNELVTANQLSQLIFNELQQIKNFTDPGGVFETTIKQNAVLVSTLANLQKIDIDNIPVIQRNHINESTNANVETTEE